MLLLAYIILPHVKESGCAHRPVDMHEDYLVAKIIRIKVSGDPIIYQTKGPFSTKQHRKIINIYTIHDLQEGH
jgi:hypothetical protein